MAENLGSFNKKIFSAVLITVLVVSVILLVIYAINIFLLAFAGIIAAVLLRGLARLLTSRTKLSINISLVIVIFGLIFIITGFGFILGPNISEGFNELGKKIPVALNQLEKAINHYSWGRELMDNIKGTYKDYISDPKLASKITGVFSSTLNTLLYFLVMIVVALYTAFEPGIYKKGIIKLVPQKKRERVEEVFDALRRGLSWWLVGRFSSMAIIGITTSFGLWILGVPLAITLGIIAAVLTFVPNIGPFLSAIPAILIGLVDSPLKALYVAILYIVIQLIESYLITPLIQKRTVSLPPALLITVQILMGVWIGAFGLLLATPLMVVVIILVQMLYIEDTLGDNVELLGDNHG